ncbi:MAG: TonB-dependent receptor [Chitinispirillaceae bacterium]|nr:TonB-dependent receptor [Chitinispirillaceae bacterium]
MIRSGTSYSFSILGIPGTEGSVNRTAKNEREKALLTLNFLDMFSFLEDKLSINGDIGYLWWRDNIFWTSLDEDMGSSHGTINTSNSFSESESKLSIFYGNSVVDFSLLESINTQLLLGAKYSSIFTETYTSDFPHGDWPGSSAELISAMDINIKIPFGKLTINTTGGLSSKIIKSNTKGGYNDILKMEIPSQDTLEKPWALKGGFQLKYKDYYNLFFNAARYSNIPNLRERYGTNGAVLPNPNLKEEKGNTFECGFRFTKDIISTEVVGFIVKNKDKIVMIFDGNMTKPANLGASCTKGIESSLILNPISFVKLELRSTFQNPENLSLFNNYYKKKLPNEPFIALLGKIVIMSLPIAEINYWVDYRSYFYRDFGNTQRIPDDPSRWGMDFHNVLVKLNPVKNINVYFSIRNLSRITLRYEELTRSYESDYSWILYPVNEWCLTVESSF